MDRRLAGALLVMVVLCGAIVAPMLGGQRLGGVASPIHLPDPPQVGSCLLYPLASSAGDVLTEGTAVDAGYRPDTPEPTDPQPDAAKAVFGPCGGQVAGEVVQILQASGDVTARRAETARSDGDCRAATFDYTGLLSLSRQIDRSGASPGAVRWVPAVNLRHVWIQPEPLQRAVGRTWLACVVTPTRPVRYTGSLAAAFAGGSLPSPFGVCWDEPDVSTAMTVVDCAQPHRSELVSVGVVADNFATNATDISGSCVRLASRVVGRNDPTADGTLRVALDPEQLAQRLHDGMTVDVTCFVTANAGRRLAGTLVGLGDRPIPFTL